MRAFLARTATVATLAVAGIAVPLVPAAGAADAAGRRPLQRPRWHVPNAYVKPRPEAMADPTELTLAEAAWMIRAGKLSP